jgi:hypothetical protein
MGRIALHKLAVVALELMLDILMEMMEVIILSWEHNIKIREERKYT